MATIALWRRHPRLAGIRIRGRLAYVAISAAIGTHIRVFWWVAFVRLLRLAGLQPLARVRITCWLADVTILLVTDVRY
jgi:hypothetical protein